MRKKSRFRNLDSIEGLTKRNKQQLLRRIFKKHVAITLSLHIILTIITILYIFIWWDSGYILTLFLRALLLARIGLLLHILTKRKINILKIYGTGDYYKIIRHVKYYPSLGIWLLIGFIDIYLLRWSILFIDLIHFLFNGPITTLQFSAFILLDLLYILEFYLTVHILYYRGIRRNVQYNLLKEAENNKFKIRQDRL